MIVFWVVYKLGSMEKTKRVWSKKEAMPGDVASEITDFYEAVTSRHLKNHEIRYAINNSKQYEFDER